MATPPPVARAAFSVGVFCGSRPGRSPAFAAAARELGAGLAAHGWRLVYGGGGGGLMGELARAVRAGGGDVLGIIPRRLILREAADAAPAHLVVTETMFARKELMLAEADAFVILPGGMGTLDEFMEVLTLKQLGYLPAPIIVVDVEGLWSSCLAALGDLVQAGFAEPSIADLYARVDSAGEALALIERSTAG